MSKCLRCYLPQLFDADAAARAFASLAETLRNATTTIPSPPKEGLDDAGSVWSGLTT